MCKPNYNETKIILCWSDSQSLINNFDGCIYGSDNTIYKDANDK